MEVLSDVLFTAGVFLVVMGVFAMIYEFYSIGNDR